MEGTCPSAQGARTYELLFVPNAQHYPLRSHLQGILELVLQCIELAIKPAELAPHYICCLSWIPH